MFNSYEMTQALVADRQSSFRRDARNRHLLRLARRERRHPRPTQRTNQAA